MVFTDPLRPLRPATEGPARVVSPEDSSSKRKNARTACSNCKKRKLKCSGLPPCENCNKAGMNCTIDETTDQRRKQVLKRKADSLDEKGRLFDRLVSTLRESDRTSAAQIVNLIRGHATLDELRTFIDNSLERSRLEKTPELIEVCGDLQRLHESEKRSIRHRPNAKEVSDIVLFHVPAFPWTTVAEDDYFVSHLLSLWFTWTHPFLNWIDKDLFIRDMQSKNPDATFCSPFLVNIMLADACAYSVYPEAYAVPGEQWSQGLHFYKEAKRHLEQIEGRFSVADVQGLGILYLCSCLIGKDRSGWTYLGQLAYAVEELARKHKPPPPGANKETLHCARAVDITIWGLFNLASMTALSFQKGGLLKVPRSPYTPLVRDIHRDKWTNYPVLTEKTKSHNHCLFKAMYDVSLITYDLTWSLFGNEERKFDARFVEKAEGAFARLYEWYSELPNCLEITNAPPHVLSLHMKYHTIIQTIFGVLKGLPKEGDSEDRTWAETRRKAQEKCVESARASARLIDMHRDLWGLDRMTPANVHWITVSMFTLLEHLSEEANREALISLSVAAKAFSHRWELGKGVLRLFQVTAKQMEVKMPAETDAIFTDFETRFWSSADRKVFSSQYPNFANSMKHGEVDDIELDMYLAKFDELHISDDEQEEFIEASQIGPEEEIVEESVEEHLEESEGLRTED